MKLKIKQVEGQDIGALRQMIEKMLDEIGTTYPVMDAEEIDRQMLCILATLKNPRCLYLIAYDGKKPAGFFLGEICERVYGKPHVFGVARDLYVVPEKRHKGIMQRLIQMAVKYAADAGVKVIEEIGVPKTTQLKWDKLGFKHYLTNGYMLIEEAPEVLAKEIGRKE